MANEDGPSSSSGASGDKGGRKRPLDGARALQDGLALYKRLVREHAIDGLVRSLGSCSSATTILTHKCTHVQTQDKVVFPGSHHGLVMGHDHSHFCDSLMYGELSGATLRRAFQLIDTECVACFSCYICGCGCPPTAEALTTYIYIYI